MPDDFRSLTAELLRKTRLNPLFFAQAVRYRSGRGEDLDVDVHVRQAIRLHRDPQTNEETVIETIQVEIAKEDLNAPPSYGDRIYLNGDSQAYLYQYTGRETMHSYKATYERQQQKAQGV